MLKHEEVFKYSELIDHIKNKIPSHSSKIGVIQFELDNYIQEIDEWAEDYREIYNDFLKNDLAEEFNTPISESFLKQEVDSYIKKKKQDTITDFKKQLEFETNMEIIKGVLVSKKSKFQFKFFLIGLVGFGPGLYLLSQPNNTSLNLGLLLLISTALYMIHLYKQDSKQGDK